MLIQGELQTLHCKQRLAQVIHIDDLQHEGVRPYAHLTDAQLRNRLEPAAGLFIAESLKVIQVALAAGVEPVSLLTEERHLDQALAVAQRCPADMPIYTASDNLLQQLTGYRLSRGILCAMRRPHPSDAATVCAQARRIAVVDSVVNATNVGVIFRGAAALGFDAVLLSPTCCDPLNRRSVRVSMGTVFQVPWAVLGVGGVWPEESLRQLHLWGFTTVAMALRDNALSIDDPRLSAHQRLAVVLGSEGDGLPAEVIHQCDYTVCIPMQNGVDSLNVAAAAAIAFWQLRIR